MSEIENRLGESDKEGADAEEYVRRINLYRNCDVLTRETCLQLIDRVTVGEKSENGAREIHVFYKFSDKGCRL